ncbi:MAG: 5-amino-6-(D-ribitylamino)uracil--L-tyrosine 4-hydroxyphenyl transferase CofH [Candidatus Lokiarchaeota archaeon]|nr:5-amino-6-(D-ribitylamino)uracil--L-tyrosine 4-hydroxyphenyl transferase CofH [Candidatus Lokiarchaeota archaeon]
MESEIFNNIETEIKIILNKALQNIEISSEEALKLLKVHGKEFFALQYTANEICLEKKEDIITFVINRNINFTNVCFQGCKFCSFSLPANHEDAFCLNLDEIKDRVIEAKKLKCTEVCIQGGINPNLKFDFYLDILKVVKEVDKNMHTHAFSPQEIFFMSKLYSTSVENTLKELKMAGLDSIPGTAAEILVDDVRKIICPNKVSTQQWIDIISTAHNLKIPTTSTIMYGHIESLKERIEHLNVLREIQKETKGFTELVPLPFVKVNPILSKLEIHPLNPSYGMADLKLFCVSRLFLNNYVDNLQCSWPKLGPKFAQVSLNYGVNDFGGTLIEENISKSAGAEYGEYLPPEEIIKIIQTAGKHPAQRDTLYNIKKYY